MKNHEHIFGLGPMGLGKRHIASALCRERVGWLLGLVHQDGALFRDLSLGQADGRLRQLLKGLNRIDVLVVADCAMAANEQSGPQLADAILDPLVHDAHRIEMRGESMPNSDERKEKVNTRPAKSCGKDRREHPWKSLRDFHILAASITTSLTTVIAFWKTRPLVSLQSDD